MARKRRSKHRSKKVTYYGMIFDSQIEGARYMYLRSLQEAGEISELEVQPAYVLQEGFTDKTGKRWRPIKYIADFRYRDSVGALVIEDVKGYDKKRKKPYTTDVFRIKEKLFRNRYPDLDFRIVTPGKWSFE